MNTFDAAYHAFVQRNDGWRNVMTGIGVDGVDKRLGATASITFRTQAELDALYHADGMHARIVDLPPDEMTREGIKLTKDPKGKIRGVMTKLKVMERLNEGMKWGRQSGMGGVLLGVHDGQTVDQPLDEGAVSRFEYLTVFDKFELRVSDLYEDPISPKYGEPLFYQINPSLVGQGGNRNPMQKIHESRMIRFDGILTKRHIRMLNLYSSISVLERSHDVIRDFVSSHHAAAVILQDFGQGVYSIENLSGMLASDKEGLVIKRLKLLDYTRSVLRSIVIDAEKEDFSRVGTPVSGMDDLLDQIGKRLSAETGIPLTLLLGESPGGLNATGDSDHRNFYNTIKAQQEMILRPALARVLRLIAKAKSFREVTDNEGEVPFEFNPLWQPSDADIADCRLKHAQAAKIYLEAGVLTPDEVRTSFAGNAYTHDIVVKPGSKAPGPPVPPKVPGASPSGSAGAPA